MLFVLVGLIVAASVHAQAPEALLYGMSESIQVRLVKITPTTDSQHEMQLETINTTTAQPVYVWPALAYEAQGQGLSSIDVKNGIKILLRIFLKSHESARHFLYHRHQLLDGSDCSCRSVRGQRLRCG